jgi:hypothetical protein
MTGAFVLAAVIAAGWSPFQRAADARVAAMADPPATPTPALDPCKAHPHLFCGPIRIVPADPAERRMWYVRAGAEVVDALVSAAAESALASVRATSISTRAGIYTTQWRMARGAASDQEATGFYRLFAGRNGAIGLAGYLFGFALWDSGESAGAHALQHFGLRTADTVTSGLLAHLSGASSWHTSAWLAKDQRLVHVCLSAVSYPGAPPMHSISGCPDLSVQLERRRP